MSEQPIDLPGSYNPADGTPLDPVAWNTAADVKAAVEAARVAQRGWAGQPQRFRNDALRNLAREIVKRRAQVAAIMALETGRSPAECILSEIVAVIPGVEGHIRAAGEALAPERVPLSMLDHPGKRVVVEAVPRGVVGIIAPWNYPLMNFFKSLFPALLAGNALVLKPSEFTPRTGAWLAALCDEVLPKGLVTCVQGDGVIGAALIDAPVDALVFTGSLRTGRRVAAAAGSALIPCSLELGGKDAAIVLADCNLTRTIAGIGHWSIHNAGQDCASIERVYVEAAIADRFVDGLVKFVSAFKVAPGDGPTEIGPLQNAAQMRLVESHVADAVERGATVRCGGARTGRGLGFEPTILDNCTQDMRVVREETFGPVIPILRVPDADTAVAMANDNAYGLGGSVWTSNAVKGEALARRLDVGMCWVNNHAITSTMTDAPWTGTKGSGPGIAQGKHAFANFVRRRVVMVDTNKAPDAWWFPANADLETFADAVAERTLGSIPATFKLLGLLGKRVKAIQAAASR
jgi:acyl-CoA reductase-like NAD-dependent aldehyde dehydrogenase